MPCRFVLVVPKVFTKVLEMSISHPNPSTHHKIKTIEEMFCTHLSPAATLLHPVATRRCFQFPETRLIQYDCGVCIFTCINIKRFQVHRFFVFYLHTHEFTMVKLVHLFVILGKLQTLDVLLRQLKQGGHR